ncbi:MAG: hypothetical protein DRP87_03535 [Spirochaetes bacterium]|nr:MAG: hypothetical protein DRP87_03535 [Spirochaetota bacterium]
MKFKVKGNCGFSKYLEILEETEKGYRILISTVYEDYKKDVKEFMSKELFSTCLRTGYLSRVKEEPIF